MSFWINGGIGAMLSRFKMGTVVVLGRTALVLYIRKSRERYFHAYSQPSRALFLSPSPTSLRGTTPV